MKKHLFFALIAACAGILFGYGTGIISGAILFIERDFALSAAMNGIVVGVVLIGALFGALLSGWIGDALGRKKLLILASCLFLAASLETAFSPSIAWLIAGRVLIGISVGIASYTAPLYISEISPPESRGALVSLNQLAVSVGIVLSYVVNYACGSSWSLMFGLGVIPAALLLMGLNFIPDTPSWLLLKGHEEKARDTLLQIRGSGSSIDHEVEEIKKSLKENVKDWKAIFLKKMRPAVLIGCGIAFIQQITGINVIIYYAPTILNQSGFEGTSASILVSIVIGALGLICTLVSLMLIDKYGRRPLLMVGIIGMVVSLATVAWSFSQPNLSFAPLLSIVSICFYIISFSISLGPITWLLISEIYPLKIRGMGVSLATSCNWLGNFLIIATFLSLTQFLGTSGTFLLYMIISLLSLLFVYFLVPETKGVSLEKIEAHLQSGRPMRKLELH